MTFEKWLDDNGYFQGGRIHGAVKEIAHQAWMSATAAERERCAKLAEEWSDPEIEDPQIKACMTAYSESQICTAPAGIAKVIRESK